MTNRRRLVIVVALAAAVVVAAAGAIAVAAPFSGSGPAAEPGSAAARSAAVADARKRLSSFVPPPGSHKVGSLPKSLQLNGPFTTVDTPRFLDVHAFWVSPSPVASVRAYLAKHTPPGARRSIQGEAGGRGGTYRWDYGYSWPELANVASERELQVGVVARPGGGSAIRADAQATYLEPKPKDERIPAGAGYLEAEETLGHQKRLVGTASASKIEATATLIDDLPIIQSSGPTECGAIPSEQATLKATFRTAPGGPILAETEQTLPAGFCDFIDLTIEGKEARGLFDEGEGLTKSLQHLLAQKYKEPLSEGIEF
jgi:hypothetical protein